MACEEEVRDKIIDDLLRKEPKRSYTDLELFSMGFLNSHEVETYLSQRFYGTYKFSLSSRHAAVVTRRSKRVWDRIGKAIANVQLAGGRGIYKISERYSYMLPELGYIFAHSTEEAEQLAQTLFSFLAKQPEYIEVKYVYASGPEKLDELIKSSREKYERIMKESEKELKAAKEKLRSAKNILCYLEGFSSEMFSETPK